MRPFDYFIKKKEVLIVSPNDKEAKSIEEDTIARFGYFSSLEINQENSKFIFENIYEAIREILDAKMLSKGLKSYSHQAPIVFARDNHLISDKEAIILDKLRDLRNKSKYYGKKLELNFAKERIDEAKRIFEIL
jgi:hypothetical protein